MSIFRKKRFWRTVLVFAAVFVVMFGCRLYYGYQHPGNPESGDYIDDFFGSNEQIRRNYATEKTMDSKEGYQKFDNSADIPNQDNQAVIPSQGQKYEKTATIKSRSSSFENDEQKLRKLITGFEAIIQFEQNSGNKGYRELHMSIGVVPEKFDSFYVEVLKIGKVKSRVVMKTDKTNEYRGLNARKASLLKTLDALNSLSSKNGQIPDFIALSDKIREVEEELQNLGVELGNFDQENEFCTVRISLLEAQKVKAITLMQRVKVSLEWTIKYYAVVVFSFAMVVLGIFLLFQILRLVKTLAGMWMKKKE